MSCSICRIKYFSDQLYTFSAEVFNQLSFLCTHTGYQILFVHPRILFIYSHIWLDTFLCTYTYAWILFFMYSHICLDTFFYVLTYMPGYFSAAIEAYGDIA